MNAKEFNSKLVEIGRRYEECIRLKNYLKIVNYDDIMINLTLMKRQKEDLTEGSIEKNYLLELINNEKRQSFLMGKKPLKGRIYQVSQLSELFPFDKIAHVTLVTTCLKGSSQSSLNQEIVPQKKSLTLGKLEPIDLIIQIIIQQIEITSLRKQLIPFISLYIPMTEKNLTLQELKDYLLLGQYQNKLSPENIILGLNGFGGKSDILEFEFYSKKQTERDRYHDSSDEDQTILRIEQIMDRLNKRVDNFGKQWLINQ